MPTVPTVAQTQGRPTIPTDVRDRMAGGSGQASAGLGQLAAESLPGASSVVDAKESQRYGAEIMPALRNGDYAAAAKAFGLSTLHAIGSAGNLAADIVGASGMPSLALAIDAWHGSPHTFDKFSLDKIGTGEGAQAYGHGLYFTDSEAIAKKYRDDLTNMRVSGAQRVLTQSGDDVDAAIEAMKGEIDRLKNLPGAGNDAAKRDRFVMLKQEKLDELLALKESGSMSQGAMYNVALDVEPDELLDWDKPLSQQSEKVRAALTRAKDDALKTTKFPDADPATFDRVFFAEDTPAWEVMNGIASLQKGKIGEGSATDKEVAAALKDAGIPGIRYLDGSSRGKGEGSYNYVLFDDQKVAIKERNGKPVK
jgi:hypothetical protein